MLVVIWGITEGNKGTGPKLLRRLRGYVYVFKLHSARLKALEP